MRPRFAVVLSAACALQLGAQPPAPTDAPGTLGAVEGTARPLLGGVLRGGAYVVLEPLPGRPGTRGRMARTDSLGAFRFDSVAPGAYVLEVTELTISSGRGYHPIRVDPGETVRQDVLAAPRGFTPEGRQRQLREFEDSRGDWYGADYLWDYRFTMRVECFCQGFGSWELEVHGDSATVLRRPLPYLAWPSVRSVDGLFAWIEGQLRDPGREVRVRYHPTHGYPVEVFTNTRFGHTDSWTRYRITAIRKARRPE